jgi:hypothetical protein
MLRRGLPGLAGQSLKQGWRVVNHHSGAFVGIDTSKLRNAVAVAEEGRGGEVRYFGEIDAMEGAQASALWRCAGHAITDNEFGRNSMECAIAHAAVVVLPTCRAVNASRDASRGARRKVSCHGALECVASVGLDLPERGHRSWYPTGGSGELEPAPSTGLAPLGASWSRTTMAVEPASEVPILRWTGASFNRVCSHSCRATMTGSSLSSFHHAASSPRL